MMGVLIAAAVAVGALLWIVVYVLREHAQERIEVDEELHDERTPTLEYAVPTGQDPVVILSALERAGYTATVDPNGAHQVVMIACPPGVESERAEIRSVIESASVTTPHDGIPFDAEVRFTDER
jgi:hypothetical protein